jgi:hypothetical protein
MLGLADFGIGKFSGLHDVLSVRLPRLMSLEQLRAIGFAAAVANVEQRAIVDRLGIPFARPNSTGRSRRLCNDATG